MEYDVMLKLRGEKWVFCPDDGGYYARSPSKIVTWCTCRTSEEAAAVVAELVAGQSRNLERVWIEDRDPAPATVAPAPEPNEIGTTGGSMTTRVRRMTVNQPSTAQPHHNLDGTSVLAILDEDVATPNRDVVHATAQFATVWFLSGPVVSQRMHRTALSDGWPIGLSGRPWWKALENR